MRTMDVRLIGFSILHLAGTLAIPVLIFLLTGCIKKEEPEPNDGQEVQAIAIATEIVGAMEGKTLVDSKVADYVLFQHTEQVFTNPEQTPQLYSKELTSKNEGPDTFALDILNITYEVDSNGQPKVVDQQVERCEVLKDGSQHNCNSSPMSVSVKSTEARQTLFEGANYTRSFTNYQPSSATRTYHNLSVVKTQEAPPALVANAENCRGIPNCILNVTKIEFDEVVRDGEARTRYHHEMVVTRDVPFLGAIMRHCVRYNHKFENRYFPVTLCEKLADLRIGQ